MSLSAVSSEALSPEQESAGLCGERFSIHIKRTQESAEPGLSSILPSCGLEMKWVWDNHVRTVLWKVRGLRICHSDSTVLLHAASGHCGSIVGQREFCVWADFHWYSAHYTWKS